MSQVKINRAMKMARIGSNPGSASDMLAAIPASTIAGLTARQLAELLDAMWSLAQASKAIAARDACAEGAIWDAQAQQMRELRA